MTSITRPAREQGHALEPAAAGGVAPPPRLQSQDLFRQSNVVHIEHQGQLYLLRRTRQGKLILTK